MNIRFTLVAEGSTDAALLPILNWAVRSDPRVGQIEPSFAEPGMLPPMRFLADRIRRALELFPADLLFVHRDADRVTTATRRDEIHRAVEIATRNQVTVPVVPVRMTEAWLLIDDTAIRSAAGNPRGTVALDLPRLGAIEEIAAPKNTLHTALRTASELRGRRLQKFNATTATVLVGVRITDFTPLQRLSAFKEFEDLLHSALDTLANRSGG